MFRIFTAVSIAILMGLAPAAWGWPLGIRGNGSKVVQQRPNLTQFKHIEIDGSTDALIREGDYRVAVNIDSNLQSYVTTEVRGDTLVVSTKEELNYKGVGRAEISMPSLEGVDIHGSGDVQVERMSRRGPLALRIDGSGDLDYRGSPTAVELEIDGSGDAQLQLDDAVGAIQCEVHGSGDVKMRGRSAGSMSVALYGSGDFDARDLPAHGGRFVSHSSGDIKSTLTGGPAEFNSQGSGDIDWWGDAQVAHQHSSSSGDVRHHG